MKVIVSSGVVYTVAIVDEDGFFIKGTDRTEKRVGGIRVCRGTRFMVSKGSGFPWMPLSPAFIRDIE